LGSAYRTVQNHLANIFQKLNAESRTEAVMRAVSLGMISASIGDIPKNSSFRTRTNRAKRCVLLESNQPP